MFKLLLKDQFVKNSFIFACGTVFSGVFGYLFHFVISRKLSVSQYGEAQSIFSLLAILTVFGSVLNYFIIKYSAVFASAKDYNANRQFIGWLTGKVIKISLIISVLFLISIPFLSSYLNFSNSWSLVMVAVAFLFSVLGTEYAALLMAWEDFVSASLVSIYTAILKLVFAIGIVLVYPNAAGAVLALLLSTILNWGILKRYIVKKFYVGKVNIDSSLGTTQNDKSINWKEKYFSDLNIKSALGPIFIFSFLMLIVNNIDVLLVRYFTSPEITGHYSALGLLGKIILTVNGAVIAVVLPSACANGHDGKSVSRKLFFSAYGAILFVSLSGALFYFLFPSFTINMLFGDKYIMFGQDLWLFAIMNLFLSLLVMESNFEYAKHNFKVSYILGLSAILMALSIYFFHSSIREIVLGFTYAFVFGYVGVRIMSYINKKVEVKSP